MSKLRFSTLILVIVLAALTAVTTVLLSFAYRGSQQALDQALALSHEKDHAVIDHLLDSHLRDISRTAGTLADGAQLRQLASDRDMKAIELLLQRAIGSHVGSNIHALVVQLRDGPLALAQDAALFHVYLPLAELASRKILTDTWTPLSTRQNSRDLKLLRLSLPIIGETYGEVLGHLHTFVMLSDNFRLLSQIQSLTGAEAVILYVDGRRIGALGDSPDRIEALKRAPPSEHYRQAPAGIVHRYHYSLSGETGLEIGLLTPGHALSLLNQAYLGKIAFSLPGVIVVSLLAMLAIRRLLQRSLQQLVGYTEMVAEAGPDHAYPSGRFNEFNRVGKAVEAMVRRIHENEHRLQTVMDNTPNLVFIKGLDRRYELINPPLARCLGRQAEDIIGRLDDDLFPSEMARKLAITDQQVLARGRQVQAEYLFNSADQGQRFFLSTKFPLLDDQGHVFGIGGVVTDLTQHRQATEHLQLASQVFACAAEAILVLDADKRVLTSNRAYHQLTGFSEQQSLGQRPPVLTTQPAILEALDRCGRWQGEASQCRADGESFAVLLSISKLEGEKVGKSRFVALFSDLSQMKNAERRLEFLSHYDALTGLPNRQRLLEQLDVEVAQAARSGRSVAVLYLDLDHFKNVNEAHSHSIGDRILQQTARRIKTCLRPGDLVGRLGSDEFGILLTDLDDPSGSQHIARRIQKALALPFHLASRELMLSCSIGIALYPDDGGNAESLLRHADTAAHHVKQQGRNAIQFFDEGVNREAQRRLQLDEGLRQALSDDELYVEYQPRFDAMGQRILGAEALVRWRHPTQGPISPMTFIPLAEEAGLIRELGWQVLCKACRAAQAWNCNSAFPVPVSVNLSPRQLKDPELIPDICDALQQAGLSPDLLELEITETVVIEDINRVLGTLHELRDLGIALSVDDFGTGYSSLMYLKKLPVDTLKIDRSFVTDIPGNDDGEHLVEAIISMAHSLRLRVVAEGVETEAQQAFLQRLGCDELQGYLLGRPGPADRIAELTQPSEESHERLSRLLDES